MKPLEFYRLGVAIAQRATTEPEHRTAVNRLYYGLHHEACCRFFRRNPNADPLRRDRSRHTELQSRFYRQQSPDAKDVGRLLNNLRQLRNESDYNLAPPLRFRDRHIPAQQLAGVGLRLASELLQALETYSPGEAEDGCICPQA